MKTIYFAIVAVLATAVSVAANSTLVTSGIVPVGFLVGPPPTGGLQSTAGSYNLVVPKYNGPNILIGVSYTLDVYTYAQYDVVNKNNVDTAHTATWQLDNASLLLPNFSNVPGITSPLYAQPIGILIPNEVASGTTVANLFSTAPATTGPLGTFTGPGNVTFVFSPSATSGVNGSPGNENPLVFTAARINVTYTYSDIPEASTYAAGAILLAGAGLVARRRLAAK